MSVQGITRQPLGEVDSNTVVMASPHKRLDGTAAAASPVKKNDYKRELFTSPRKTTALPEPLLDENSDRCVALWRPLLARARVTAASARSRRLARALTVRRVTTQHRQPGQKLPLTSQPARPPHICRFCMFPIKFPSIWEMYKKAEASFWTGVARVGKSVT